MNPYLKILILLIFEKIDQNFLLFDKYIYFLFLIEKELVIYNFFFIYLIGIKFILHFLN